MIITDMVCQECHINAPERQWIYERNQRCVFIAIITLMLLLGFARCVYVCTRAGQPDVTVREAKDWNEVPERLRK